MWETPNLHREPNCRAHTAEYPDPGRYISPGPFGEARQDGAVLEDAGSDNASALCALRDGDMVTTASNGIDQAEGLAASELVQRCYRTLDTIKVDLPDDVRLDGAVVGFRPRSIVAYPLHIRLVPIGVLILAKTTEITDSEGALVRHLLPNFAVALNNALAHERLQRVAAIDPLTGLYNRRFGLERLSQEFSRSVRSKEPFVAVLPGAGETDVRGLVERIRRVVESSNRLWGSSPRPRSG